ncbi:MAG: hypothetical protein ACLUDU_13770 [Butyricimonas faecihominis]
MVRIYLVLSNTNICHCGQLLLHGMLTKEFLSNVEWLNDLKLRVSYGLQGNVDKNTSPYVVGEWNSTTVLPG